MGPPFADPGEGEGGYEDVRDILHHGRSGDTVIWVGYMSGNPLHDVDPGGFHHQVTR